MKKFFFFLLLLSFSLITTFAQDSTQISAWNSFKTQNPGNWTIRWNDKSGTPAVIYLGKTKQFKGTAKEIASSFLKENHKLIKMKADLSDLKFVRTLSHRGINDVKFQQTFNGIPVEGAEYMVHILSDGSIDMINGTYYPKINISGKAIIPLNEAFLIALKDIGHDVIIRKDTSTSLIVYHQEDSFLLVWKLQIPTQQPYGNWIYYIDASNGNIIKKLNALIYIDGYGNVYPTHPGISNITNVTLSRLGGSGYLWGTYANVLNNLTSRAYSSNNYFNYTSYDTHFDEVNAYYHINLYRGDFISGLGFDEAGAITATVHINANNSWFDPSNGQLFFGDGDGIDFNDFAKEDKIIYHEYTHYMSHSIANLYYSSTESGAIEEGNADYFPGSYTDRSIIGDYVAPNFFPRDMNNPRITNYSEYNDPSSYIYDGVNYGYHEPHFGGELWSATMWDLHNDGSIGPSVTDLLVYNALFRVTTNATFLSYNEAIMAEDLSAFGGTHITAIQNCFAQRGIGWTGTIAQNTTWSGIISVVSPITVNSGVTLTITPGTSIYFSNGASLIVNGELTANGSSGQITFDFVSQNSSTQNGIIINSTGTASISYATIKNAYKGISIDPSTYQSSIENSTIQDCYNGIVVEYGSKDADLTISNNTIENNTHYGISIANSSYGMNSEPTISGNTITGCDSHGIYAYDIGSLASITGNTINYNSSGAGIAMYYSSPHVTGNDIDNNYTGIGCGSTSSPDIDNNKIHNNYRGVYSIGSDPFLGREVPSIDGGNNSITGNTFRDLQAESNSTIMAEHNWWGSADTPDVNKIVALTGSTIDYDPWLPSDPNSKLVSDNEPKPYVIIDGIQLSIKNNNEGISYPVISDENLLSNGFDPGWTIMQKILYAKNLINNNKRRDAQNILKDIINAYPDSSLSSYALNLFWNASRNNDVESLKPFLSSLSNKNEDKDVYGLASIIFAFYDKGNKVKDLDNVMKQYSSTNIKQMALFGKFLYYMNEAVDFDMAKEVLMEIDRQFPNSAISEDAHIQLGDKSLKLPGSNKQKPETSNEGSVPKEYSLSNNYPNPFNPATTIKYQLPQDGFVTLKIFDALGREVKTLVSEFKNKGYYSTNFDGTNLSSGMYIYQLKAGSFISTKKMLMIK